MYQQEIKTGQSFSFERFLDVVPWKNFDWNKILSQSYEKVFGAERIKALPFELFFTEYNPIAALSDFMEVPYFDQIYKNMPKRNNSISRLGLELFRDINAKVTDPKIIRKFRKLFESDFPKTRQCPSLISQQLRQEMHDYFLETNTVLLQKMGFGEQGNRKQTEIVPKIWAGV